MADNSTPIAGGDTYSTDQIVTLNGASIATGEKAQRVKAGWGADGVFNDTTAATPLPVSSVISQATPGVTNGVQLTALSYPASIGNNSTTQLAAGATFTGIIETVLSLQAAQIEVVCDQPYTVYIDQFIDLAGTKLSSTYTFSRGAGVPLNENVTLPGNYLRVRIQNTGASTTTTFQLDTTFGIMDTLPNTLSNAGNLRVAVSESLPSGSNAIGTVSAKGLGITGTSGSIAAAGTGTVGPLDVSAAGNVTFTVKNTVAASAYAGAPVIVFEQSDDNVQWGPLSVTRADSGATASTFTLGANTANGSLMFDAAIEGVNWIRARVTTGPATNAMTITITGGGFAFSPSVSVIQQPIIKAVQGVSGITTQDLKDAGRVAVMITCYRAAGIITTEALFAAAAFSRTLDGAVATTGQQFTVSAGKRFRIQAIEASLFGNAAAATTSKLVLRYLGAGGTITNTSPIAAIWDIGSNVATTANYVGPMVLSIPDGLEFIPGSSFGFTNLSSAATVQHTITIIGYEY